MDLILFLTYKIILNTSSENETIADNTPVQVYVNKIKKKCLQNKNRIKTRIAFRRNNAIIRELGKHIENNKDGDIVPKLVNKIKKKCLQNKNRIKTRIAFRRNNAIIRELGKHIENNKDGDIVPKLECLVHYQFL